MFTRRIQIVCVASVLLLLAAWQFRSRYPVNDRVVSEPGTLTEQVATRDSSSPANPETGPAAFRPAFRRTFANNDASSGAPQSLSQCFAAPDLSGRPHPTNDRAEWIEWRKALPFPVLLGAEELGRIQSGKYGAAFNVRSKKAREEDLLNGKNKELWERLDELKAGTKLLSLQQSAAKVVELLGEPSVTVQHQPRLDGEGLVLDSAYDPLTVKELLATSAPFSLYYQLPNWAHTRASSPLRRLLVDFTADGRLFQWYFDPVPDSPDW
jgi:hypothetical protein